MEQAKFTYSPLEKALEKQGKTIKDQGIEQVEALKALEREEALKLEETLKALKPEENQELELIEGLFPKIWELMKLKLT